ncbi:hypothetical protein LCGC14_1773830 [marine sediment metagenome]|uniref:Uncharacterized protein n=1 Tax=marine sediment metagenome TaxID=412755 RepID=A0A0F9JX55_9ZZZZ
MQTRLVRKGRIKLGGRWWRPSEQHLGYDGRLDGHRFVFHQYPSSAGPLVCLWGTEAQAQGDDQAYGPELVDGAFPWYWWHPEKEAQ